MDVENYTPLVRSGGLVIFHDCGFFDHGTPKRLRHLTAGHAAFRAFSAYRQRVLIQENEGYGLVWK